MFGIKKSKAITRVQEEAVYEVVAEEMRHGHRREGLWVKAFAKAGGDEAKAKAIYIEQLKQSIIDDIVLREAEAEQRAREDAEKNKREVQLRYEQLQLKRDRLWRDREAMRAVSNRRSRRWMWVALIGPILTAALSAVTESILPSILVGAAALCLGVFGGGSKEREAMAKAENAVKRLDEELSPIRKELDELRRRLFG